MAYDPHFTGGVNVAVGDVNGDGIPDIVTGPGAGGGPDVRVFDGKTDQLTREFMAYDPRFLGGVSVAVADVNADGFKDIITGAGPGGGPQVDVFSGKDSTVLRSFYAYAPAFTGGVFVAGGDVNGDGHADIITGAGAGGGPHVEIFSGVDNSVLQNFYAYAPTFMGGVSVGWFAGALMTGTGPGSGPRVVLVDPLTLNVLDSFYAYDPAFTGGVFVGGAA
jgi:hypothetical protein